MAYILMFMFLAIPACFLLTLVCWLLSLTSFGDTAKRKQDASRRIRL